VKRYAHGVVAEYGGLLTKARNILHSCPEGTECEFFESVPA
jgi:hypothetical protein